MSDAEQWWQSTPIYQVYPRSFNDSNGDGIGDLPGIIERLPYLAELGVGAVWVSPFFASPQRDVGYDISDFRNVAPEYGTLDDAQRLIDAGHEHGLKVLFDLVLNHTSDEHPWFLESQSSRENPRADWYVWADGTTDRWGRRRPPNNWRSELQLTRAWQWSERRGQWYLASFLPFQPDLNWRNAEVRAELFDTIRMWLERGVDGFRLDIFGSIMQDDRLRDNPARPTISNGIPRVQTPDRTINTDDNIALAADLRAVVDEFGPDRALLGEVFGSPATLRRYVRDDGRDGLHLVFLFDFLATGYRADKLRRLIDRYEQTFPAPLAPTYVLENHDRTRSLSRFAGDLDKARVMATVLLTLRGVPVIYQGQEIGMENHYIPLRDAKDPVPATIARWLPEFVNRQLPERLNRDEVRTPMQWNADDGAGFTEAEVAPWLPLGDDARTRNVESEKRDPGSLLAWYRSLLRLRARQEALSTGALSLLPSPSDDVILYERTSPGARWVVAANFGDRAVDVATNRDARVVLSSRGDIGFEAAVLSLGAHRAAVIEMPAPT